MLLMLLLLLLLLMMLMILMGEQVLVKRQMTATGDLLPFAVSLEATHRSEIEVRPAEIYLMWKPRLDDQHASKKELLLGLCCRHRLALTGGPFEIIANCKDSVMLTMELH